MTERIAMKYHRQDDDDSCGAAVVQMVLAAIEGRVASQAELEREIRSRNATRRADEAAPWDSIPADPREWDADPTGVEGTLNARVGGQATFAVVSQATHDVATAAVTKAIGSTHVAAIVLTDGGEHWKVVTGYQVTEGGLTGVFVLDPWPAPTLTTVSHSAMDECGRGVQFGNAEEHIAIGAWRKTFDPVEIDGSWQGRHVAIVAEIGDRRGAARLDRIEGRPRVAPPANEPRAVACSHLDQQGLLGIAAWRAALEGTVPGEPRYTKSTCMVPMVRIRKSGVRVPVIVRMQAQPPWSYLGAVRASRGGTLLELDPRRVAGRRAAASIDRPFDPASATVEPTMYWEPCCESRSPYDPFVVVHENADTFYVRSSDGVVFDHLTPRPRGTRPIASARPVGRLTMPSRASDVASARWRPNRH